MSILLTDTKGNKVDVNEYEILKQLELFCAFRVQFNRTDCQAFKDALSRLGQECKEIKPYF